MLLSFYRKQLSLDNWKGNNMLTRTFEFTEEEQQIIANALFDSKRTDNKASEILFKMGFALRSFNGKVDRAFDAANGLY
jgi:hypothetical protein